MNIGAAAAATTVNRRLNDAHVVLSKLGDKKNARNGLTDVLRHTD